MYNAARFLAGLISGMFLAIPLKNAIESSFELSYHKRRGLEIEQESPLKELEKCRYSNVFKYRNNKIHSINSEYILNKFNNKQHNINLFESIKQDIEHSERAGFISPFTKTSVVAAIDTYISEIKGII